MKVVKILFFFFLIGSFELKAQTNFVKGYYITAAQDTVRGFLEYRTERRNFRLCVFKPDFNGKPVKLSTADIKGYSFGGKEFYEKHSFKSKKGSKDESGEELYGFFKILVRGSLSLMRYHSRYFVEDQDGKIYEISKKEEMFDLEMRKDYTGYGMLKALMKDCEQATADIVKVEPDTDQGFIAIFEKYYDCTKGHMQITEAPPIKLQVDFGLEGSAASTKVALGGPLENARLDGYTSFAVGAFSSFFLPKVNEKFRFLVEASYLNYKNYAYFHYGYTNNDVYVRYSALRIPVLMRYNWKAFFFDAGFQSQYVLSQGFKWRIETSSPPVITTTDGVVDPMQKWSMGYLVGAGVKYKLADHILRSSVRFSNTKTSQAENKTSFQTLELMLSIQIYR
jgi:hypothetical protein